MKLFSAFVRNVSARYPATLIILLVLLITNDAKCYYGFGKSVLSELIFLSLRTTGQHIKSADSVVHKILSSPLLHMFVLHRKPLWFSQSCEKFPRILEIHRIIVSLHLMVKQKLVSFEYMHAHPEPQERVNFRDEKRKNAFGMLVVSCPVMIFKHLWFYFQSKKKLSLKAKVISLNLPKGDCEHLQF